ncbi:MAG TPA: helix-turn-helix domain-containing protein [Rhizomicrobium sp.]|jgi:transcriptional regulator with XRE-family HTH domain
MIAADFIAWRHRLGLNQTEAAAALGLTARMIRMYELGTHPSRKDRRGRALPVTIPRVVELACSALEFGPLSLLRARRADREAS